MSQSEGWWAAPYDDPRTARPPVPNKRRTWLLVLAITLPLVLLVAGTLAAAGTLTRSRPVTDAEGLVSIRVPGTWRDETPADAQEWVDGGGDGYRVPDLAAAHFLGDQFVEAVVTLRSQQDLATAHAAAVGGLCAAVSCTSRGEPRAVSLHGRAGLEQVLDHPDDELTTSDLGPEVVDGLRQVMQTTVLTR